MSPRLFRPSPSRRSGHPPPPARLLALLLAVTAAASTLPAQTLARPGWAGSGLTVERWWKHAVILDLPNPAAIPTIDGLDNLRSLGIDAILLRQVATSPPDIPATDQLSTPTSIDNLFREASRRRIRVLVELPADQPPASLAAAARSWAARGAAGFLLAPCTPDALRSVRSTLHAIPGERILIAAPPAGSPAPTPLGRRALPNTTPDLELIPLTGLFPQLDAAQLRATLAKLPGTPLIAAKDPAPKTSAALKLSVDLDRVNAAAVLLLTTGASLIQESSLSSGYGPPFAANPPAAPIAGDDHSVTDQLRQFTALHHDRPAFRDGPTTPLDHTPEGAAVWIRRDPAGAIFVVACNLRSIPLRLSLTDDLARLHLRGAFLKTISRADPGLGAMPLNALTLPPFGVYVGELSR